LGKEGELLLGEGSDAIRDSVCALIEQKLEPLRLLGMLTQEKLHPEHQKPMSLHDMSEEDIGRLKNRLAFEQDLTATQKEQVDNLIDQITSKKITHVNLMGWSRGGYNAIRIANRLNETCPNIQVNILALDPVPGPGNHTPDAMHVPSNVKHYVSVLTKNEYRLGFLSIIPKIMNPARTDSKVVTIPGDHDSFMGDLERPKIYPDPIEPLQERVEQFVMATFNDWGAVNISINSDIHADQDWKNIGQHRAEYTHLSESSSAGPVEVVNSKAGYRLVHDAVLGRQYINVIPALQYNPPNELDEYFDIASDTCTLHRDYNDEKIVSQIAQAIDEADDSMLYRLFAYVEARYQISERNEILREPLEKIKDKALGRNIFLAACVNDMGILEKNKLHLDDRDEMGDTPLIIAARYGNESFLQALINSHAQISLMNKQRETALIVAAQRGNIATLQRLLKHCSEQEQIDALIAAAKTHQKLAVNYLADAIDLSSMSLLLHAEIRFLLIWTIENNDVKLLSALIEHSHILLDHRLNAQGQTVVKYAQDLNRQDIVSAFSSRPTAKPFLMTLRTAITFASACALGYSATVLGASLHAAHYSALTKTLFVANSLSAPVGVIALVLASLAVIALLTLERKACEHSPQHKQISATINL
jgi:hypothetical protein